MQLLAIIEVSKERRVYCQEVNCTRAVYREVHIVEDEGQILVLGSTCYAKRYGRASAASAKYGSGSTRTLSDSERELLLKNTQALIAKFEQELAEFSKPKPQPKNESNNAERNSGYRVPGDHRVNCSYCRKPMLTHLSRRPARGYRCEDCKTSRLSDHALKEQLSNRK